MNNVCFDKIILSIKDTFTLQCKIGLMSFHATECKMFIDLTSALQMIFKKLQPMKFGEVLWMTIDNI